ncbi:hypothetical protein AAMO2058_001492000, partial [Amorphochlora amoebiformis]
SQLYDLYAVINHLGTSLGGHYVSYVAKGRGPKRRWYCFDDENVQQIDKSFVKSSGAYMLFYHRRDSFDESLEFLPRDVVEKIKSEDIPDDLREQLDAVDEHIIRDESLGWCQIM